MVTFHSPTDLVTEGLSQLDLVNQEDVKRFSRATLVKTMRRDVGKKQFFLSASDSVGKTARVFPKDGQKNHCGLFGHLCLCLTVGLLFLVCGFEVLVWCFCCCSLLCGTFLLLWSPVSV